MNRTDGNTSTMLRSVATIQSRGEVWTSYEVENDDAVTVVRLEGDFSQFAFVRTAKGEEGKALPLPCVSTAFVAETVPFRALLRFHRAEAPEGQVVLR